MKSLGKARYINLVTSNRWGKTFLERRIAHFWSAKLGNAGNCGLYVGQDFKAMARNFTRKILYEWGPYIARWNRQEHFIELINGHMIYEISAENIKSIEGASDTAYAIIDEASLIDEGVLEAVDTRAIDCRAPIFTASTAVPGPGIEWLEEQYEKGLNPQFSDDAPDYYSRYASFTGTMWDNAKSQGGYLSDAEIENYMSRRSQKELAYRVYGGFPKIGERVFDESLLRPEVCGYRLGDVMKFRFENYVIVDTASGQKESERGDDTAIVVLGVAPEYGFYVHEIIASRMGVDEIERTMLEKAREYNARLIGIESIAAQINYLMTSLRKSQLITDTFRIVPISRHGGDNAKPARHGRLEPYLRSGRLKFPVDEQGNFIKGCDKVIKQMKATPYTHKTHDDCIDALADICAPELGIVTGFRISPPEDRKNEILNPVMSKNMYRDMRNAAKSFDSFAWN